MKFVDSKRIHPLYLPDAERWTAIKVSTYHPFTPDLAIVKVNEVMISFSG